MSKKIKFNRNDFNYEIDYIVYTSLRLANKGICTNKIIKDNYDFFNNAYPEDQGKQIEELNNSIKRIKQKGLQIDNMGFQYSERLIIVDTDYLDFKKTEFKNFNNVSKSSNLLDFNFILEVMNSLIIQESISSARIEGSTIKNIEEYKERKSIDSDDTSDPEVREIDNIKNLISQLNTDNENNKSRNLSKFDLLGIHSALFKGLEWTTRYGDRKESLGRFSKITKYISSGEGTGVVKGCSNDRIENEIDLFLKEFNKTPKDINDANRRVWSLHVWFESIHPFSDGNGRIGRLLFPIYYKQHDFTKKLSIFMSNEFERNNGLEYYKNLTKWNVSNALKNKSVEYYSDCFNRYLSSKR